MSYLNQNFTAHACGLSKLLAHAILDFFPEVELQEDFVQNHHFCYRFSLKKPFDISQLELLENRMIEVKNKGFELYLMEMVPKNAGELFRYHNQKYLENILHSIKAPLVQVVKLNEYYDLVRYPFEKDLERLHFKLTHFETEEVDQRFIVTIFGIGAENANALKNLLKTYKEQQKRSHLQIGIEEKLFEKMGSSWTFISKGAEIIENLKKELEVFFLNEGFQRMHTLEESPQIKKILENASSLEIGSKYFLWAALEEYSQNPLDVGLFKINSALHDQWAWIVNKEQIVEGCISCLKFYTQIIKILGFSYRVKYYSGSCPKLQKEMERVLEESAEQYEVIPSQSFRMTFELSDSFGRNFLSPSWTIEKFITKKKIECFAILGTFCKSIEKLFIVLLEEGKEGASIKLSSQHLKILTLKEGKDFGKNLYEYFKNNSIKVTIDDSTEKLSTRLSKAFEEKASHIAIVGQKEQEDEKLTVKMQQINRELKCSKEELLEHLLKELKER